MKKPSTALLCLISLTGTAFAANPPDRVELESRISTYNDEAAIMVKIIEEDESRPEDNLLGGNGYEVGIGVGSDDSVTRVKGQVPLSDKGADHQFYGVVESDYGVSERYNEGGIKYRTDKNAYGDYASEYYIMLGTSARAGKEGVYHTIDGSGVKRNFHGKPLLTSCYIKAGAKEGFRLSEHVGVVVGYGVEKHGCVEWIDRANNVDEDGESGYRGYGSLGVNYTTERSSLGVEAHIFSDRFGKSNDVNVDGLHKSSAIEYRVKGSLAL